MEELGMGFLLGIFLGLVAAILAAVLFAAKRAHSKTLRRPRPETETAAAQPQAAFPPENRADDATRVLPRPDLGGTSARRDPPTGNTMILEAADNPEQRFSASVQEVRDLLLTLAELIARTENASGKAADAFQSARDAVRGVQSSQSPELREAQRLLLSEIDRVLATNEMLHSELDIANRGIAEQRRQIDELRVQARVDGLTRIPNRAAFDERLLEYIALFERSALVFTMLLVDIDHFKRVNDDYGHVSGDRILRGIAAKLSAGLRANDFVARYGGEEFALLFPGTALKDALDVAERLRADIAKTNFRMDKKTLKITISGGLTECAPGMKPAQVVANADEALYRAKNGGRNQILQHEGK
jgi:diguanylate cyclase (GGDEF)-like protein